MESFFCYEVTKCLGTWKTRWYSKHIFLSAEENRNKNIIKFQSNLLGFFLNFSALILFSLFIHESQQKYSRKMEKRFWFNNKIYCLKNILEHNSSLKSFSHFRQDAFHWDRSKSSRRCEILWQYQFGKAKSDVFLRKVLFFMMWMFWE